MSFTKIQFIYMLLLGAYYVTTYSQTNNIQNLTVTPTASNFTYPQSVFVDSHSGNIWVTDFDNNRVLRFDVSVLTSVDDSHQSSVLSNYFLSQNYPNPFNPSTKISWQSPVSSWQTIKVYDVLGDELATLVDEFKPAGSYEVEFNTSNIKHHPSSGIYFYQLKTGSFIQTKKMVLVK
jgi:hypothetical protein